MAEKKKHNMEDSTPTESSKINKPQNPWLRYYLQQCDMKKNHAHTKDNNKKFLAEVSESWRNLSEEAKLPFRQSAKQDLKKYNETKSVQMKKAKEKFVSRTSTNHVVKLISSLEPCQKEEVKHMGLGGLLDMKLTSVPRKICLSLVKRYDLSCNSLKVHGAELKITSAHVERILGISTEGSIFDEMVDLSDIRSKYFGDIHGGAVSLKKLEGDLKEMKIGGDNLRIKFGLFVLGYVLCPTSSLSVNLGVINTFSGSSRIGSINWAKYVLEILNQGVRKINNGQGSMQGCILFLMLYYFHYVLPLTECPCLESSEPLPIIAQWDDQKVAKRVKWWKKNRFDIAQNLDAPSVVSINFEAIEHDSKKMGSDGFRVLGLRLGHVEDALICQTSWMVRLIAKERKRRITKMLLKRSRRIIKTKKKKKEKSKKECGIECEKVPDDIGMNTMDKNVGEGVANEERPEKSDIPSWEFHPMLFRENAENVVNNTENEVEKKGPQPVYEKCSPIVRRSPQLSAYKGSMPLAKKDSMKTKNPMKSVEVKRMQTRSSPKGSRFTRTPYLPTFKGKENGKKKRKGDILEEKTAKVAKVKEATPLDDVYESQPDNQILVAIGGQYIERSSMLRLREEEFVDSAILSCLCNKLTYDNKTRSEENGLYIYVSPLATEYVLGDVPDLRKAYRVCFGRDQFTGLLPLVKGIFIPINHEKHWFVCVLNVANMRAYILDSSNCSKGHDKIHRTKVGRMLHFLEYAFKTYAPGNCLLPMFKFMQIERVNNVPKQNNGFDCGVYVAKHMINGNINPPFQFKYGKEERRELALSLFFHKDNEKYKDVLEEMGIMVAED